MDWSRAVSHVSSSRWSTLNLSDVISMMPQAHLRHEAARGPQTFLVLTLDNKINDIQRPKTKATNITT